MMGLVQISNFVEYSSKISILNFQVSKIFFQNKIVQENITKYGVRNKLIKVSG